MDPVDVVLTKNAFVVLASDTRLRMLKRLNQRRMTVAELAGALNLAKSTVHHHARILADSGFVTTENEGHVWVYYTLTPQGRALLNPNDGASVRLLLNAALVMLVGGICVLVKYLIPPPPLEAPVPSTTPGGGGLPWLEAPSSDLLFVGLALIGSALVIYTYVRWRNARTITSSS